jgi:methyl-accepting chemotaxis protein
LTIANASVEQSAATAEISTSTGQAADSAERIAAAVVRAASSVQRTDETSTEFVLVARQLSDRAARLKSEVNNYLKVVGA